MKFRGNPIVGVVDGNNVNLLANRDNRAEIAAYIDTLGGSSTIAPPEVGQPALATAWSQTSAVAIANSPNGYAVIGNAYDNSGVLTQLVWNNVSDNWQVGPSGVTVTRPTGMIHDGSSYVIADGSSIRVTSFTFTGLPPAGGLAPNPPVYTENYNSFADTLAYGTQVVGTSLTKSGSWTTPGWIHDVDGLSIGHPTTSYATTYTFPGASGTNLQKHEVYAKTVNLGNTPPTEWGNYTIDSMPLATQELYDMYYGVAGGGLFTVSWTEL
jgi:hypothetical protein